MIDTIVITSPFVSNEVARQFELKSVQRYAIDNKTSENIYCFTSARLSGSWDSSIRIGVKRERWEYSYIGGIAYKEKCEPYLEVECSLHKLVLGHNIAFGSDNLQVLTKILYNVLCRCFDVKLPNILDWIVKKIDNTYTFDMGNINNVHQYLLYLNNLSFTRRDLKVGRYSNTGVFISGSTTTVKFYAKGDEFKIHDYKKLKKLGYEKIDDLQKLANNMLRIEVSIKNPKLKYDFSKLYGLKEITVRDITEEYLQETWKNEIKKILKGDVKMDIELEIARTSIEVQDRLHKNFTMQKADILYSFWVQLSTVGEQMTKQKYHERTYRRHLKDLENLGISYNNTDIQINANKKNIISFVPRIDNALKSCYNNPNEDFYNSEKQLLAI